MSGNINMTMFSETVTIKHIQRNWKRNETH